MRPRTPADALEYPAAWLRDLHLSLDLRCACTWSIQPSLRLMLTRHPSLATEPLGRILLRLRCQRTCRQPPTRVALLHADEHAARAGNGRGGPAAWELVLVGE